MKRRTFLGIAAASAFMPVEASISKHAHAPEAPVSSPLFKLLPNIGDGDVDARHRRELAAFVAEHRHLDVERIAGVFDDASTAPFSNLDRPYMHKAEILGRTVLSFYKDDEAEILCSCGERKNRATAIFRGHYELFLFLRKKYSELDSAAAFTAHDILNGALKSFYDVLNKELGENPGDLRDFERSGMTGGVIKTVSGMMAEERERQNRILKTAHTIIDICQKLHFPLIGGGFKLSYQMVENIFNHESEFDPLAQHESGAAGLTQFMPTTWHNTLLKLSTMPFGEVILDHIRETRKDFDQSVNLVRQNKAKDGDVQYQKFQDMRFDPDVAVPVAFAYLMDDAEHLTSVLGRHPVTIGDMWLINVLGFKRGSLVIREAAKKSGISVASLIDNHERVIPDPYIIQNSNLLGSPAHPHTLGDVMRRVQQTGPIVPVLLAREFDPSYLEIRRQLLEEERVKPRKTTPAPRGASVVKRSKPENRTIATLMR